MKRMFNLLYRGSFVILVLSGILFRAGVLNGFDSLQTLYSFTTISNMYSALITAFVFSKQINDRDISTRWYKAKVIGVLMMLVVGVVYHFILLPEKYSENPSYEVFTYGNIIAHYVAPLFIFIDWLLLDKKNQLTKKDLFATFLIPVTYFIIAIVYGLSGAAITGKRTSYVYFFMDVDQLGFLGVLGWSLLILAIYGSIVFSIYRIDQRQCRTTKK